DPFNYQTNKGTLRNPTQYRRNTKISRSPFIHAGLRLFHFYSTVKLGILQHLYTNQIMKN
ncbi:MAG: hypothetical protein IKE28_01405, partial [Solobacterium sp.]|nr:hypothetical protein [Solobacterium sp.]